MLRNSNNGGIHGRFEGGFNLNKALHTQNSIDEEISQIDLRITDG